MSTRILLLSNVRPSRSWKIAQRIAREIPGAEVCGIVQRSTNKLPYPQQLIAAGNRKRAIFCGARLATVPQVLQSVLAVLVDVVLWCIHGCPKDFPKVSTFTTDRLREKCSQAGSPLLVTDNCADVRIATFIRDQKPDLAILAGELALDAALLAIPGLGTLHAWQQFVQCTQGISELGTEIRVDYVATGSETARTIAHLTLPWGLYDGQAGHTLKADLMTDDLLMQAVLGVTNRNPHTSERVTAWMETILAPALRQAEPFPPAVSAIRPRRYRRIWKLCLDTLLLCSPFVIARNWYRRWRARYPLLILTHHLVTDHPHRMGISTESFWLQARFLQRHYRIVSLSDAVDLLHSGELSVPTAVLTFDDGYADNFLALRAVAEEMEIPITHFIVTHPIETHQEFEHDLAYGERGAFPMTWDQIRYWNGRGAEFGSHTRTHLDCACTDRAILRQEILESRSDIEAQLGRPVPFFAFPFGGRENISPEAEAIAASAYGHFASGFGGNNVPHTTTCNGHLFRRNLYAHPWELELELQSVFDWVERIRRGLHLRTAEAPDSSRAPLPIAPAAISSNPSLT